MSEFNLVPNPRAHADATLWSGAPTRVTTVPWGAMPDGADAALRYSGSGGGFESTAQLIEGASLPWTVTWGGESTNLGAGLDPSGFDGGLYAEFYDDADEWVAEVILWEGEAPQSLDAWHINAGTIASGDIPAGAAKVALWVIPDTRNDEGGSAFSYGYFTLCCLGADPYGDGDTEGWEWDAAPHASVSREVAPVGILLINGGATVVFDDGVTLRINSGDIVATEMRLRNAGGAWGEWETYATSKPWTLTAGRGPRTVEAEFR